MCENDREIQDEDMDLAECQQRHGALSHALEPSYGFSEARVV